MDGVSPGPQRTVTLKPGGFVFREGDASKDLYIVKSGNLRIFKREAGIEIDLGIAGAGSIVGEVAAIDKGSRSASCEALEPSELVVVPVENFNTILNAIPDWLRMIANVLVRRLREVNSRVHRIIGGDCAAHVALLLSYMTCLPWANKTDGAVEIPQKTVESEMMDILQVQMQDVSRALVCLKQDGYIDVLKGNVVITDVAKLEAFGSSIFTSDDNSPGV
jgi:CRP/FNR family transcriptional regulator